jgi:hypothetical protein
MPEGGNDTIYGNGSTGISYENAMVGVRVDLKAGVADARLDADKLTDGYKTLGRDTFSGVYGVRGTALDDELLARAEQLCGPLECSALLRQALQALVQRESAKRLAALGGSESGLDPVRGPPTNRAFSRCLFSCSFPSAAAKPPASLPPAFLPHADERCMVGVGDEFIGL